VRADAELGSVRLADDDRPGGKPLTTPAARSSAPAASASAASGRRLTIAFTRGLTTSIRSRCQLITSCADSSRVRIPATRRRAVHQCSASLSASHHP
jgi:hypothetical protein